MKSSNKDQGKKNIPQVQIFNVPFPLGEIKENSTVNTNTPSKPSEKQIINQAIQFHLKGNIPEATKCYQYCIKKGFNDHRVFCNYGIILRDLDKLQEAELSIRKAIKINPDIAETHSSLGAVLKDLGKLEEAELSTIKAIELKPDYSDAYLNLGNILRDLDKLQEAELSISKAIEINPDFAMAHFSLGNILYDLGKLKDAELSYRKAIEIKPDYAESHHKLSLLYSEKNDYKKAYKEINLAIKYDSKNHIYQGELNRLKFITDP